MWAVHTAIVEGRLPARIVAVVGTREEAPAILRAREAGLGVVLIDPKACADDAQYACALEAALVEAGVEAIALTGYMRKLPVSVVERWKHRIVNIHPGLLPAFGGKGMYGHHVHEAVIAYGAKLSGCTAHLVDAEYDTGPVVLQRAVPVLDDDTSETLAARILPVEHETLVETLRLLAEGRLRIEGRRVRVNPAP